MTNQQGAPEAPRGTAADGKTELFNVPGYPLMVRAADFNRLHAENERLAALVGAQQPAAHVQNPAEIEHVAGDVSKNGAESNIAQQPAPSDAAAQQSAACDKAPAGWLCIRQHGHDGPCAAEPTLSARSDDWVEGYAAGVRDGRSDALRALQPSTTPQADSQPAPVPTSATGGDWTQPTTVAQRLGDAMQLLCGGKRPPDDMVQQWLDNTSESLQEFAASNGPAWAQGIGLIDAALVMVDQPTEITAIDNPDRDHEHRAAHTPADSVTAPAGGAVAEANCPTCGTREVSIHRVCHNSACKEYGATATLHEGWKEPTKPAAAHGELAAFKEWMRTRPDPVGEELAQYLWSQSSERADWLDAARPAQAADSVLDAARLWEAFIEAWRNEIGVDKIVNIMGGADKLKAVFLDAARK